MSHITTERYKTEARKAIKDRVLQSALASVQDRLGKGTAKAYRELPEGPGLRRTAHDMRMQAVENLDILLETLADNIGKNGGRVIFADVVFWKPWLTTSVKTGGGSYLPTTPRQP